ncbi:flagellar hook-associated protein 1 FlgK [Bacillus fengqiuensis]|nr:flagellar hook-associated protein 1 FlgK [Bacillus fengqiuensis]
MRSTFHALETARRGMLTQQAALYTTGHNIANANTPGYTRQRVNFVQTEPYPAPSMNRPQIPGQLGTGVEAASVQRVRESFLDVQYRGENQKLGYWQAKSEALAKMEEIMNEPSEEGLAKTMDRFWQSLQDLAVNPSNSGARSVVRERGVAVAETFNYLANSLKDIQGDLKNEIDITVKQVNSLAEQINNINKQISEIEPHGYLPNDLYDERDRLIDELSQIVNIDVSYTKTGGKALAIAEGMATIRLVDANGTPLGSLVEAEGFKTNELSLSYNDDGLVENFKLGDTGVEQPIHGFSSAGKLKGLIESNGYIDADGKEKGVYAEMLYNLDVMAYDFAQEFNRIHSTGWNITDINTPALVDADPPMPAGTAFFAYEGQNQPTDDNKSGAASLLKLHSSIEDSLDNIAAASTPTLGDGKNALALAEVKNNKLTINGNETTVQNYYESIIGGMAVNAQEADRLMKNSGVLLDAVQQRRDSTSAVSLDEEMTNMIQFQHAYNASARMITVTDELLDKIINGMGMVGR